MKLIQTPQLTMNIDMKNQNQQNGSFFFFLFCFIILFKFPSQLTGSNSICIFELKSISFTIWRYVVVITLLSMYTGYYFNRSNMSVATSKILNDTSLDKTEFGTVLRFLLNFFLFIYFFLLFFFKKSMKVKEKNLYIYSKV